ncbi:hypothetical protein [Paraburkholderia tropica]|uniref:hypothetical protein n=1 Tax=Paraburkholderia tropica TaxID=92647 RepID=UPI001F20DBED|nr:hypothetical protein [Paraburkholderia tropica]
MVNKFSGFATLKQPEDLYLKLVHDRKRMTQEPCDPYSAFDFFVTAEHLLDWVIPGMGKDQRKKRGALRDSNAILRVVSHVANGSKHFVAESQHHQSVDDVVNCGYADDYATDYYEELLVVQLSNTEQKDLGVSFISTLDLANRAIEFWKGYLGLAHSGVGPAP